MKMDEYNRGDWKNWYKKRTKLIEGPIIETFGVEAWFADIEDNYFLIFVPLLDLDKK